MTQRPVAMLWCNGVMEWCGVECRATECAHMNLLKPCQVSWPPLMPTCITRTATSPAAKLGMGSVTSSTTSRSLPGLRTSSLRLVDGISLESTTSCIAYVGVEMACCSSGLVAAEVSTAADTHGMNSLTDRIPCEKQVLQMPLCPGNVKAVDYSA